MAESVLRYYILFANYAQGLALHAPLDEHHGEYDDIVLLPGQIQAHRDQYWEKTLPAGRAAIARRPWGRFFSYIDSTAWKITRTAQRCAHRFRILPLLQHDRRRW